MLPPPRSFSQGATSFVASYCLGIHQMLFSHLRSRILRRQHKQVVMKAAMHTANLVFGRPDGKVTERPRHSFIYSQCQRSLTSVSNVDTGVTVFTNLIRNDTNCRVSELVEPDGFEPTTSALQRRRSPS